MNHNQFSRLNLKNSLIHFLSKAYVFLFIFHCISCAPKDTKWKGQAPIKKVSTKTKPVQFQLKKTYEVEDGLFFSNEFDGARMNGVALTGEDEVTVLITPENTPINISPWYAFKIWSNTRKNIKLKISYNEGTNHRYYPKISKDCFSWSPIDSTAYFIDSVSVKNDEKPKFCIINLSIGSDTTWIAAQEIINSKDIYFWSENLAKNEFVDISEIGQSKEGRPVQSLKIGNSESKKLVLVLSRQHPPEVTGWLAMKAFVERVCDNDELARKFLAEYCVHVVPCVNPDGVDHGHWRHGVGGIDLNRDWEEFNQPETQNLRRYMNSQVKKGGKFYFFIDFHSTFQDIYYTISPELKGNMPGLVPKVISAMGEDLPGYDPNIRPNALGSARINSTSYIFYEYGAEAVTYEVGDNTPRDIIKTKGELTAQNLMEIMLEK